MLPDALERQGLSLNLLSKLVMPVGVDRGAKGPSPPKFLEHIVILYFERRFSKQNSVIRLKSDILAPPNSPPNSWAGYAAVFNGRYKDRVSFLLDFVFYRNSFKNAISV